MTIHIVYFSIVVLVGILSALILGPGSELTFAFLIGIVTIPLAFIVETIPFIGLTLFLSLPLYLGLAFVWPARPARVIFVSIALALLLSAGTSFAARTYLAIASEELISTDFTESIDVSKKHVLVTNVVHPEKCGRFCRELFWIGGANAVTQSKLSHDKVLAGETNGSTFGRITSDLAGCTSAKAAKRSKSDKHSSGHEGTCIRKMELIKGAPTLLISEPFKVSVFQEDSSWSFDPFEEAVTAERVLVFDISTNPPVMKIQQTSVAYFPPSPVLWPIAIKGPHSSAQRGFYRQTVEAKSAPGLNTMIFGGD